MSSTGAINAGRAGIEVFLDRSRLERDGRLVQARLQRLGQGVSKIGKQIGRAGLATATPLGIAVRRFADVDQALAAVRAKLPDVSDADFEPIRKSSADLGRTTAFTSRQVAEGMNFLAKAGFDVTEILAGIGPVLNLAVSGEMDLALASDIASDSLSGFGLETSEFSRVVDVLATVSTSANASVEQLGETFSYAAPLASLAEQSIETVAAAAGKLADGAIKGSKAGTDLQVILKSLADPTTQKRLRELGVNPLTADGSIKSLTQVFEELAPAIANLPTGEKVAALADMFGRAAKSAGLLVGAAADPRPGKSLRELEEKLNGAAGEGQRMADVMGDTLAGEITRAASAADGLGNAVGKALSSDTRSALVVIQDMINAVTDWVGNNQKLVATIGKLAAGAVIIGGSLVALGGIVTLLSGAIGAAGLTGALIAIGGIFADFTIRAFVDQLGLATEQTRKLKEEIDDLKDVAKTGAGSSGVGGRLETGVAASDKMPKDFQSLELNRLDSEAAKIEDPDERAEFYVREAQNVIDGAIAQRNSVLAGLANGEIRDRDQESLLDGLFSGPQRANLHAPELDRDQVERELFQSEQLASALRSRAFTNRNELPDEVTSDEPADNPFQEMQDTLKAAGDEFNAKIKEGAAAAGDELKSRLPKAIDLVSLEVGSQAFRDFDAASKGLGDSDEAKLQSGYMKDIRKLQEDQIRYIRQLVRKVDLPTNGEVD